MVNIVINKVKDEYAVQVESTHMGVTTVESKEVMTSLPFALGTIFGLSTKYENSMVIIQPEIILDIMEMIK